MKKTIVLFCLIIICGISYCVAQSSFGKVTSQTADFVRYGLIPVSYYEGKAHVEIPLYTIQDPDFCVPLSLSYTSDGLKPAKHPGLVGLDWVLNFGGIITREIYGSPDDANGYNGYSSITGSEVVSEKGFWNVLKERKYSAEQLLRFDPSVVICNDFLCQLPYTRDGHWSDGQPDLFMFRFPGKSGSFMINNNGSIKSNCPEIKVDLSNMTTQYAENKIPQSSKITITDGNGYIYVFGSDLSAIEYRQSMKPTYTDLPDADRNQAIMAWHLVQIQAPNGRVLNISYQSDRSLNNSSPHWQASSSADDKPLDQRQYSVVKGVYPAAITIPDTGVEIEFITSIESCRKFYNSFSWYNSPTFQLDMIHVKQSGKPLLSYRLQYENKQHLRFLKEVRLPNQGVYTLAYRHTTYPEPDTRYVDFWGYWSGNGSSNSGYSLLSRITYPTGGVSDFSYERHSYRYRVDTRIYTNSFIPSLIEESGTVGGFRISRISNKGIDVLSLKEESRTFIYQNDAGENSGILCQYPPYIVNNLGIRVYIQNDVWYKNYNIEDHHIGYSMVRECFDDGSFINYTYSDYKSNPDKYDAVLKLNTQVNPVTLVATNVNRASSASQERGRLMDKEYFSKNKSLIKKESYSYLGISNLGTITLDSIIRGKKDDLVSDTNFVVSFHSAYRGAMVKKVHIKPYPLEKSVERDYINGNSAKIKTYKYNALGQLSEQTEDCSEGNILKQTYIYPAAWQVPANTQNVYTRMVSKNLIDFPVEEHRFMNAKRLSSTRTTYRQEKNIFVKDTLFFAKGGLDYQLLAAYPLYDNYGNVRLEVNRDGIHVLRLWGYKHRYLIAEICNFTLEDIQPILNIVRPESLSEQEAPDFSFIGTLRNSFPDIQVYLYTYSPLIGVTSVEAPNGEKINYQYDSAGRLVEIRDHSGEVVNKYDYHYRP